MAQKSAVFEEEFNFRNTLTFVRGYKETPIFFDDELGGKKFSCLGKHCILLLVWGHRNICERGSVGICLRMITDYLAHSNSQWNFCSIESPNV